MFFKISGIQRQVFISLCCYIGQILCGIGVSWSGPMLLKLQDTVESPLSVELSETQMSLIASLLYIGALPSPYIMGWLSNVKGRKPCVLLGGLILLISYLILLFSKNLAMMYFGRMTCGFGIGCICVTNLVYIGEIASKNIRGILLTILGICSTTGSIVIYSSGLFLTYFEATSIGLVIVLFFILFAFFISESPMFYLLRNDDDELRKILEQLGRSDEIDELIASKKEYTNKTTKKDWQDLLNDKINRKALIILICANIFLQCSGIISITLFSGKIFSMAGSSLNPNFSMIVICCCQLVGALLVPCFVEKFGRRILMMVSCIICSLCMLILGFYFYFVFIHYSEIINMKWLPLSVLILFFFVYDIGLGIIPTTLMGEMFKTNVRSKGSAVVLTSSWLCGFLVSTAFGTLMNVVGIHFLFWMFSCSSAIAFIFTLIWIPETKGKSLLEIQMSK